MGSPRFDHYITYLGRRGKIRTETFHHRCEILWELSFPTYLLPSSLYLAKTYFLPLIPGPIILFWTQLHVLAFLTSLCDLTFESSTSDTHSPLWGFQMHLLPSEQSLGIRFYLQVDLWDPHKQMWAQVSVVLPEGKGDKNDLTASEILGQRGTPVFLPFRGHSHPF